MHCPPYSNVPANFYSYNNNRFALDFTSTYLYIKGVIKIQVNLTMKKLTFSALLSTLAIGFITTSAQATSVTIFSEDFEDGVGTGFSGAGSVQGSQGYSNFGFGGRFLRNVRAGNPAPSTRLTLTDLPSHTSIDINFLLAIIDSWDGNHPTFGPDFFNVKVDGVSIFSETFDQWNRPKTYTSVHNILTSRTNLGFTGRFPDRAYDMALEEAFQGIAHTSDTLTIEWFVSGTGSLGNLSESYDESFAIDNVEVVLNGVVPEPLTILGAGTAIGFGAAFKRTLAKKKVDKG
ncbi:PEP-CTERM sorting domain-containing protein [Crocosphaera watsonii]|uniref:PEP-CTERM protein-sorting domain-containing protein n=6 Tax=Aphanothecaceae TaxID=1890450 RepID=Q4C1V3_CROWT|nr:PEP-CTERM sorting domain-containing protein [Crocosphaera watsonii]EAM50141.1 hypothetical protein CwatDRAFT_2876 [Crocosphaera watsonii WH 8501]